MYKAIILVLGATLIFFTSITAIEAQMRDADSNVYKTVLINGNEWTAENLNTAHYRNGDIIPQVKDKEEWSKLTTGAWCYYGNDSTKGLRYGKIYNWYAINDSRGLAPDGWHVASESDWTNLILFLGDYLEASGKLKSTEYWESPNKGATNEYGFSALPSGLRYDIGEFNFSETLGYFWTSSEYDDNTAWSHLMSYKNTVIFKFNAYKKDGYTVRCVKDN